MCRLFQFYAIRHFVTTKVGKKYKNPTILSFLLTIGHENLVFPVKVINRLCWAEHHGQNCFETGGSKLKEKEMTLEFIFNYFSTKIA